MAAIDVAAAFSSGFNAEAIPRIGFDKHINAIFVSGFNTSPVLTIGRGVVVNASFESSFNTSPSLVISTPKTVSASFGSSFNTSPSLVVSTPKTVSAAFGSSFNTDLDLIVSKGVAISAAFGSSFNTSLTLSGTTQGMSLCDVVDEVLAMWGIFCRRNSPTFALDRAINDINTALQLVWNNAEGRDYWSNSTLTLQFDDGDSSYDLDDSVQNVVGPCRISTSKRVLAPIKTISEYEEFSSIYTDGETETNPVAYFIDRLNQAGGDPAKCILMVTPPVSGASISLLLDVVLEAPRFDVNDLATCPIIPIPHNYIETLLLPIARYQAAAYYLFRQPDQKESIERAYQQAIVSLGLSNPSQSSETEKPERRDATK